VFNVPTARWRYLCAAAGRFQ